MKNKTRKAGTKKKSTGRRKTASRTTVSKSVTKAVPKQVNGSLPWILGGLALGGAAYYAVRSLKGRDLSFSWRDIGERFGMAQTESQSSNLTNPAQVLARRKNKPYPVESTSKRHPRSRLQMKESQDLSR